jgi:hypothetical protein
MSFSLPAAVRAATYVRPVLDLLVQGSFLLAAAGRTVMRLKLEARTSRRQRPLRGSILFVLTLLETIEVTPVVFRSQLRDALAPAAAAEALEDFVGPPSTASYSRLANAYCSTVPLVVLRHLGPCK